MKPKKLFARNLGRTFRRAVHIKPDLYNVNNNSIRINNPYNPNIGNSRFFSLFFWQVNKNIIHMVCGFQNWTSIDYELGKNYAESLWLWSCFLVGQKYRGSLAYANFTSAIFTFTHFTGPSFRLKCCRFEFQALLPYSREF